MIAQQKTVKEEWKTLEVTLMDTSLHFQIAEKSTAFKEQLDNSIQAVKQVGALDEGTKYKVATLDFMLECNSIFENECKELSELLKKNTFTPQEDKRIAKLKAIIKEKYGIAEEHFEQAQQELTNEYGLKTK